MAENEAKNRNSKYNKLIRGRSREKCLSSTQAKVDGPVPPCYGYNEHVTTRFSQGHVWARFFSLYLHFKIINVPNVFRRSYTM